MKGRVYEKNDKKVLVVDGSHFSAYANAHGCLGAE